VIVTVAPTGPLVGLNAVIVGTTAPAGAAIRQTSMTTATTNAPAAPIARRSRSPLGYGPMIRPPSPPGSMHLPIRTAFSLVLWYLAGKAMGG